MAEVKSEAQARQLDATQALTHVGSWEWDVETGVMTWSAELYRIYGLAPGSRTPTVNSFIESVHPDDRNRVQAEIAASIERGGTFASNERIIRPDGTIRVLATAGEVVRGEDGSISVLGTCRDMTDEHERALEKQRAAQIQTGEREALEALASGAPLVSVLEVIVRFIEEVTPGTIASILLLDDTGKYLRAGAAPHLPTEYSRAIDGAPIGSHAGSCGTAAFRKKPVYVEDVREDALWDDYRHLLVDAGLRACWSIPICTTEGHVLGTFAMYHREPRTPDLTERQVIERAAHVAGIAIQRRMLDDQLRALSARVEVAREEERTHIAREIHDELGQALTALKLDVGWVARRSTNPEVNAKLADMTNATDAIIASVRRIAAELRPGILDAVGLTAALEWQSDEFARRTGTPCSFHAESGDLQLERELSTAVFRIFQEALTNVTRHAGATQVDVRLWLERGHLRLDIADDGVGVPEIAPRASTLGLLGMRERARRCGGDCAIRRREPRGTLVTLTVPLRFPSERPSDREIG